MFKKLKDKLAEEVKSSPQRIQQFAQAAQAAVTSASSSISDITNSDLFSIGDNDTQQPHATRSLASPSQQPNTFQDVSLLQTSTDSTENTHEPTEVQRQRKLSNSSFASDVSFRLPSYDTPLMYHLQSDIEVSASEADERGLSGGAPSFERVTKEQLYAAYKRTQERYKKYRTQYGDLARHYKLLERENAKARSVLVETQDKALRRISELKEQCSLEQSAKAHLEKALRVEIEEKDMKIEALNTKLHFLQNNSQLSDLDKNNDNSYKPVIENENEVKLINFDNVHITKPSDDSTEVTSLSNKIEKMELLLNKYKESLKSCKDKNAQCTTEIQILSKELESKNKKIQEFQCVEQQLNEAKTNIFELNNANEYLQNQVNAFDFTKTKQMSTLEFDLQKATEEITELRSKIEVFSKKEEEYAISLAENKLSIHKELEGKESAIKSLKDSLSASQKEVQSLKIVVDEYKNYISSLEEEKKKYLNDCIELDNMKTKMNDLEIKVQEMSKKIQSLEQQKAKADEELKCLQLQLRQETAEKLAMIDRNVYLESRNTQLSEENTKKNAQISKIESDLLKLTTNKEIKNAIEFEKIQLIEELNIWKEKCCKLELEIQEEREELVKLQTEIEKLFANHELIQTQNSEYRSKITYLTEKSSKLQEDMVKNKLTMSTTIQKIMEELRNLRQLLLLTANDTKACLNANENVFKSTTSEINSAISSTTKFLIQKVNIVRSKYICLKSEYQKLQTEVAMQSEVLQEYNKKILQALDALQKENITLKSKLEKYDNDKNKICEKFETTNNEYQTTLEKIETFVDQNEKLTLKLQESEKNCQQLKSLLENEKSQQFSTLELFKALNLDKEKCEESVKKLIADNKELYFDIDKIRNELNGLKELNLDYEQQLKCKDQELLATHEICARLEQENIQHTASYEKIKFLKEDNLKLNEELKSIEGKNSQTTRNFTELQEQYNALMEKLSELNNVLQNKTNQLEKLQNSLKQETDRLESDKISLTNKIKEFEHENNHLLETINVINNECTASKDHINELNVIITAKTEECDKQQININKLEDNIKELTQENASLQIETAKFTSNIKELESEIDDVRRTHIDLTSEKNRLNDVIEDLESKHINTDLSLKNHVNTQTENYIEGVSTPDEPPVLENKWVLQSKRGVMSNTAPLNLDKDNLEELGEHYASLKLNYDNLKYENKRLQSDIEGLQSYLTKISKENSVLNDKLRDLIASSEQSDLSADVELRNEIHLSKEKFNDLLRENSLLIEENLELRDQLYSQNYSKPIETQNITTVDKDIDIYKIKYEDLLQANSQLEKNNVDLEQFNKSVNGNMQQIQEKNEKLKLSNEKLERRLDEALVSLRHLHSLQENTELEYLRNILYEYLTGSGTHSLTLAKVLSAIVKFDDGQTQMVLQKEKERQGFLRQLGII